MEKLLVIDDEAGIRSTIQSILQSDELAVYVASDADEGLTLMNRECPQIVLLDIRLGASSGLDLFTELRRINPRVLVIFITGHGTTDTAIETMKRFLQEGRAGSYDFAFIDADKSSYDAYYEHMLLLVRAGGLIAIDNVLWSGRVCDATDVTPDTVALRALNAKIKNDQRVDTVLLPITDGIFMCRKR